MNGLVPSRASEPLCGATSGACPATFVKCTLMSPASAHCSAQAPILARWWELRIPTTATPCSRAFGMPSPMACFPRHWPNPTPPSRRTVVGVSATTAAFALRAMSPSFAPRM